MDEVECPYCDKLNEVDHDDGMNYAEDETSETECVYCGRTFQVHTSIMYHHTSEALPCRNGGEHKFKQVCGVPEANFIGKFECEYCGDIEDRDPEGRKKAMEEYFKKIDALRK